ncbi:MAG: zinc ribbon domain-containing protein [Promethearchaeota archaeon]
MTKIKCSYDIYDQKELYGPNDEISGVFSIESNAKKDKKLKKVEIHVVERFEKYYAHASYNDNTGYGHASAGWRPQKKVLKKYPIAENEFIHSGETKDYPFKIELPNRISPRTGEAYSNWRLCVEFVQKSSLKASKGSDKDASQFIVPVRGYDQPVSVINVNVGGTTTIAGDNETKFCSECGKVVKKSAKFCEHCGGAMF